MPFFLFLVGSSMSLSFGKYSSVALFYKVLGRTARLFLIGIATQSADLWGGGGWNIDIRSAAYCSASPGPISSSR